MSKKIDIKHIQGMANSLENEELGAAVRLLCRMISTGRPVTEERAGIVAQIPEPAWGERRDAILENFMLNNGLIEHDALVETMLPHAAQTERPPQGRTTHLPIVSPTRKVLDPTYPLPGAPERISIRKTAFDVMVSLFARADLSEGSARSIMANLLKNWPEGDVYEAIAAADRKRDLVDPKSWIVAHLQRNSQPLTRSTRKGSPAISSAPAPVRRNRPLVSPELTGVSSKTADAIRERNRTLALAIPGARGNK